MNEVIDNSGKVFKKLTERCIACDGSGEQTSKLSQSLEFTGICMNCGGDGLVDADRLIVMQNLILGCWSPSGGVLNED